jgi:hypothetical protein
MFLLPDAAIIIPVRIDQPQRKRNLERNLAFLKAHLDTTIIVIEQDKEQQIEGSRFVRDGDTFYKTYLFNLAAKENPRSVYFFLDVDVLVDPQAYMDAYTQIRMNNTHDVCLLYKHTFQYIEVESEILDNNPDPTSWMNVLRPLNGVPATCMGGIVAVRASTFWEAGGFNERYIGYGEEDVEFVERMKRFEGRYLELPYSIYHQKHDIVYRAKAMLTKHISPFLSDYSRTQEKSILKSVLTESNTRYVSIQQKGGRLGNLLFQLACLLQYAKQVGRIPWMEIPEVYKPFFQPLLHCLQKPPLNKSPVQITGQLSSSSSVFHNELPISLTKDLWIEIDPGFAQSAEMMEHVRWFLSDRLASKKDRKPLTDVMIHVRKTDYTKYANIYEQLGEHYYVRAMKMMKKNIPDCRFVVFTDDVPSVRDLPYFQREDVTFFDDTGMKDYEVLQEMSLYSHFIIANSTFSWWGAQLSSTQGHVIAPLHWSTIDSSKCLGLWTQIYEDHWIRLSNVPMTVQTSYPLFDVFFPDSCTPVNALVLFEQEDPIPVVRPNADIVLYVTSNVKPYIAGKKPSTVDYFVSTTWEHISTPNPSWFGRPILCLPMPSTPQWFHRLQCVLETLLRRPPRMSIIMITHIDIRSNLVFQTLDTLYRQTYHSWELLFVPAHSQFTTPGFHLMNCTAIPKLLPVLPIENIDLKHSVYARSDMCALIYGGTILHENKFETQMRTFERNILSLTSTYANGAYYPYSSFTKKFGLLENKKAFLGSAVFHKSILKDKFSMIPSETRIDVAYGVYVKYMNDVFNISIVNVDVPSEQTKEQPPVIIRNHLQHPLMSANLGLITQPVRNHVQRITDVQIAKQKTGLKYLI